MSQEESNLKADLKTLAEAILEHIEHCIGEQFEHHYPTALVTPAIERMHWKSYHSEAHAAIGRVLGEEK